jgi:hypothetical protein
MDLKNVHVNKTCHFVNHPYLRKGLALNSPTPLLGVMG